MHCAILLCFPEGDKLVPPRRQALMLATSGGDILPLALAALERRKVALARLLARAGYGVQLNEHLEAEGPLVFEHACRMGLEGIVSKRKTSWYQSGRSRQGAGSDAVGRRGLATIMAVKRQQETFEPMTLGHPLPRVPRSARLTASLDGATTAPLRATGCQTRRPCGSARGWSHPLPDDRY
jgi:hypothetical protein